MQHKEEFSNLSLYCLSPDCHLFIFCLVGAQGHPDKLDALYQSTAIRKTLRKCIFCFNLSFSAKSRLFQPNFCCIWKLMEILPPSMVEMPALKYNNRVVSHHMNWLFPICWRLREVDELKLFPNFCPTHPFSTSPPNWTNFTPLEVWWKV